MKKLPVIYAILSLPLLLLTGCDGMSNPQSTNPTASDMQAANETGVGVDDRALEQQVTTALQRDPLFRNGDVAVSSLQGQVTLSGAVATSEHVSKAEDIARRVQGVSAVTNSLVLKSDNSQS